MLEVLASCDGEAGVRDGREAPEPMRRPPRACYRQGLSEARGQVLPQSNVLALLCGVRPPVGRGSAWIASRSVSFSVRS